MAQAQELRQAMTQMAGRQGPMLSAYASVNAAIPENQDRVYLVRLQVRHERRGRPRRPAQERVRGFVEEETHPGARTLAVFADEGASSRHTGCGSTCLSPVAGAIPTWRP
jgi:hypothetical protein